MTTVTLAPELMLTLATYFFIPLVIVNIAFYLLISTFLKNPEENRSSYFIILNLFIHVYTYSAAFYFNSEALGEYGKDLGMLSISFFIICLVAVSGLSLGSSFLYAIICCVLVVRNAVLYASSFMAELSWSYGAVLITCLVFWTKREQERVLRRFFVLNKDNLEIDDNDEDDNAAGVNGQSDRVGDTKGESKARKMDLKTKFTKESASLSMPLSPVMQ